MHEIKEKTWINVQRDMLTPALYLKLVSASEFLNSVVIRLANLVLIECSPPAVHYDGPLVCKI